MKTQENNSINWADKYANIKSKFKELQSIRIDSVQIDTDDLRKKILEHQKVHEISVKELKQQIQESQDEINDLQLAQKDIENLEMYITKIRESIASYDKVMNIVMRYRPLRVKCIGPSKYEITYDYNPKNPESFIFTIELKQDKQSNKEYFQYEPRRYPLNYDKLSQIRSTMSFIDLKQFLETILNFWPPI